MSRIFFISANVTVEPYPVYPLGMAVCSAALRQAGHLVQQFDFLASGCSYEKLNAALTTFLPEYVCLSLRNIDNSDSQAAADQWYLEQYRTLVAAVRQVTQVPVIVGGPGFSIMPEQILDYIGGDYGIRGEGELALPKLIATLNKNQEQPTRISSSPLPLQDTQMLSPDYDRQWVDYYLESTGVLNIQTKRGCPFRCTYCTYPYIEGDVFRPRNPQAVVDDIKRLQKDFAIHEFFFTDSVFNDSSGYHLELVEEILRQEVKVRWGAFFTPRNSTAADLALMKRSGLYAVELGTDAGCDETLAALQKDFTFQQVRAFNDACVANEIPCCHYIIFAGPGETENTIHQTLKNLDTLTYCVVLGFAGIRILPGTALYQRTLAEGLIRPDDPLLKPSYYFSPHINLEHMNQLIADSFKGRRDRVYPPEECSHKISIVKNFGIKGILWDKLIRFPSCRKHRG